MMAFGKKYSFLLLLVSPFFLHAQTADSLSLAKQFCEQRQYPKALVLLRSYCHHHPTDINALWLLAQTSLWTGDTESAKGLYLKAAKAAPGNDYLQLDCVKALLACGDITAADTVLAALEKTGRSYSSGDFLRAKIDYRSGKYKKALKDVRKARLGNTDSKEAAALEKEILFAVRPWMEIGETYHRDNQPLSGLSQDLRFGQNLSQRSAFEVRASIPFYFSDTLRRNGFLFQPAYFYKLPQAGLAASIEAGVWLSPAGKQIFFTGGLSLSKKWNEGFTVTATAKRLPYTYTRASLSKPVNLTQAALSLGYEKGDGLTGKAGIAEDFFDDDNRISGLFAYLLSPAVKKQSLTLRGGYAFSYGNAAHQRCIPAGNFTTDYTVLTGRCDPYFTPWNQTIHSALLNAGLNLAPKLSASLNGNYGVLASARCLYFFKTTASNDATIASVDAGFHYHPYEAAGAVHLAVSESCRLSLNYTYQHMYFYSNQRISLTLTKHFL